MKKILSGLRGKTLFFSLILIAAVTQTSCDRVKKPPHHGDKPNITKNWINWNFVFSPKADSGRRQEARQEIIRQLQTVSSDSPVTVRDSFASPIRYYLYNYLRQQLGDSSFALTTIQIHYCSCQDTLLWNLTATLDLDGSGQSAPSSPPPGKGIVPQGGLIDVVSNNDTVTRPSGLRSDILHKKEIGYPKNVKYIEDVVLGVIDSGIDSTLFSPGVYQKLFAPDGSGKRGFIPDAPSSYYMDDEDVRHGSAVAAIALQAFYDQSNHKALPRLMVLKALDHTGAGSVFSVSCAMGYAVRHHVNLINASLGYWGEDNAILDHYLKMSTMDSIPVIAAAGNDPRPHSFPLCVDTIDLFNELKAGHLFYPGVLSAKKEYDIISVTGMEDPSRACRYQNFSNSFVSIGVIHKTQKEQCCGYWLPYLPADRVLDGSSFATPVISGQLAFKMMGRPRQVDAVSYLGQLMMNTSAVSQPPTRDGKYIVY